MNELEKLERIDENCPDELLSVFLSAMTDWRIAVFSFDEFYGYIQLEIRSQPTKKNIELYLSKVDHLNKSWEVESLSGLLMLYDYFDDAISLKDIFDILKERYLV